MSESSRVLLVDDDTSLLAALRRQLRKQFDVDTAAGPEEGLAKINEADSFAVVISDMQMPGMNGIEFLKRTRAIAPDSVRMMLTGNADQATARDAVNEGAVYRFLTKPCSQEEMNQAIHDGIAQFRLASAEKELLEQTLRGSVRMLTEILSLVNPDAFGRATRIEEIVRQLCDELQVERRWEPEMAAMLSQLGCVAIPENILARSNRGEELTKEQRLMVRSHPNLARDLLSKVPRLERVAILVHCQSADADATLAQDVDVQIVRAAIDLEAALSLGTEPSVALNNLKRSGERSAQVLDALELIVSRLPSTLRELNLAALTCGVVLAEPVKSSDGQLLVAKGQKITGSILMRLRNFAHNVGIQEPLVVYDGGIAD